MKGGGAARDHARDRVYVSVSRGRLHSAPSGGGLPRFPPHVGKEDRGTHKGSARSGSKWGCRVRW